DQREKNVVGLNIHQAMHEISRLCDKLGPGKGAQTDAIVENVDFFAVRNQRVKKRGLVRLELVTQKTADKTHFGALLHQIERGLEVFRHSARRRKAGRVFVNPGQQDARLQSRQRERL